MLKLPGEIRILFHYPQMFLKNFLPFSPVTLVHYSKFVDKPWKDCLNQNMLHSTKQPLTEASWKFFIFPKKFCSVLLFLSSGGYQSHKSLPTLPILATWVLVGRARTAMWPHCKSLGPYSPQVSVLHRVAPSDFFGNEYFGGSGREDCTFDLLYNGIACEDSLSFSVILSRSLVA